MSNHNPPTNGFNKRPAAINRKGRPGNFDALRELGLQIAHEKALSKGQPIVINGRTVTVAEMILREWAHSPNPILQRAFIEISFGKVPDKLEIKTGKSWADIIREADSDTDPGANTEDA